MLERKRSMGERMPLWYYSQRPCWKPQNSLKVPLWTEHRELHEPELLGMGSWVYLYFGKYKGDSDLH